MAWVLLKDLAAVVAAASEGTMQLFAISTASGFLACAVAAWLVTLAVVVLRR